MSERGSRVVIEPVELRPCSDRQVGFSRVAALRPSFGKRRRSLQAAHGRRAHLIEADKDGQTAVTAVIAVATPPMMLHTAVSASSGLPSAWPHHRWCRRRRAVQPSSAVPNAEHTAAACCYAGGVLLRALSAPRCERPKLKIAVPIRSP